jgi:hypothetical protein
MIRINSLSAKRAKRDFFFFSSKIQKKKKKKKDFHFSDN